MRWEPSSNLHGAVAPPLWGARLWRASGFDRAAQLARPPGIIITGEQHRYSSPMAAFTVQVWVWRRYDV